MTTLDAGSWAGTRWAHEPHIRFGDPCYACAVPMTPASRWWSASTIPEGMRKHAGLGLCSRCAPRYRRDSSAEQAEKVSGQVQQDARGYEHGHGNQPPPIPSHDLAHDARQLSEPRVTNAGDTVGVQMVQPRILAVRRRQQLACTAASVTQLDERDGRSGQRAASREHVKQHENDQHPATVEQQEARAV